MRIIKACKSLALALVVVVAASNAVGFSNTFSESPYLKSSVAPIGGTLLDRSIWESYQRRFVSPEGRVIDTGNGGITHSEGQGYGMLIAAAAGDLPTFEKIWAWTKSHLARPNDHLFAWKWDKKTGSVADSNNASDGDLLIAWALAEAADYWNSAGLLSDARDIAHDIYEKMVRTRSPYGSFLMPASSGFSFESRMDGPIVNLSYWVFPAFGRLAQLTPDLDWDQLTRSGLLLIDASRFGPSQIPSDWLSLADDLPAPARGFQKILGYNAIRVPLYLTWSGAGDRDRLEKFASAWKATGAGVALIDIETGRTTEQLLEPGYRAIAALARCASSHISYDDSFYRFTAEQNYYPATLHILSLLAAANRGGPCLDHAAMGGLVEMNRKSTVASLQRRGASIQISDSTEPLEMYLSNHRQAQTPDGRPDVATGDGLGEFSGSLVAGVFALVLFCLLRIKAQQAAPNVDANEKSVEDAVYAIRSRASHNSFALTPRTLPSNVFTAHADIATLERQIELAAQACQRLSRTIGLIYYEAPNHAQIEARHGRAKADEAMIALAQELRHTLRATDHVAYLGDNKILVCVCLLEKFTDLVSISTRLGSVIQRLAPNEQSEASPPSGLSIYPLNGYSGAELVDAARRDLYRAGNGLIDTAVRLSPVLSLVAPTSPHSQPNSRLRKRAPSKIDFSVHTSGVKPTPEEISTRRIGLAPEGDHEPQSAHAKCD